MREKTETRPFVPPHATPFASDRRSLVHRAGELLLSEECTVAMTYRDLESPYCSQCVKPMVDETPVECEGCFLERYCSKSCAEAAEGSHHARTGECATFATAVDAEAATLIEGSDHSEC